MLSLTLVITERNNFAVTTSLETDLAVTQGDDMKPTHQKKIFSQGYSSFIWLAQSLSPRQRNKQEPALKAGKRVGQTLSVVATVK